MKGKAVIDSFTENFAETLTAQTQPQARQRRDSSWTSAGSGRVASPAMWDAGGDHPG